MAYAALISLKHTIQRLLNSPDISIVLPNLDIIEFAYKEVVSLEDVLRGLDTSSKRGNDLDGQIREAVCKLEDALESHVSNSFLSQSESLGDESNPMLYSLDLEKVRLDINSFVQMAMKIKEEYSKEDLEPSNPLPEEEDDAVLSRINFRPKTSSMVIGLRDEVMEVKELLAGFSSELEILSLVGMAGIGKTTLAGVMYTDDFIFERFDVLVWVTIGPKYQLKEILIGILSQAYCERYYKMLLRGEDKTTLDELHERIYKRLKGRRYFIVLDDIWSTQVWDYLKRLFPDDDCGSRVLLTTRLEEVANYPSRSSHVLQKHFLNKEDSWNLLCKQVFGENSCPPELEKAGKKIAEKCEGLPLTIVMVADLLIVAERTPEYWNYILAEKENSVFKYVYDQMSKVLYPSYNYLPQYLKACFLYMGVFHENYEIPPSKLIKLWVAEGFLEPNPSQTLEDFAMECLTELVSKSLVMYLRQGSNYKIKTCKLHSVFRYLSIREAGKSKFLHVLNSRVDGLVESIESQRRLCIQNNILFAIKDVYDSMASISTVRSLLCTGPHNQYPVPLCFGLRLLRVLDALTIRFYEFPIEVLKLEQLRYLALTYNGKLPSSISELWNLECLIVSRHMNIKSPGDWSYLPIEIWDMKELKHLQIMGRDLPDPNCGALLPNLLTLLDVSALSCTKGVLKSIPNLEKLGIQIELAPDAAEPLCCFDHISHLHRLESLKCVIVNPKLKSEVLSPPAPPSMFPLGLKKLSLSGFGYPWEYMSIIASMPKLEVLKLRCCAFLGPDWETHEGEFLQLKFLLLEDTNLVHWRADDDCFPLLQRLIIRHCYKLEEIPSQIGSIPTLTTIEVADCNPLVVAYVQQIQEEEQNYGNDFVQFLMDSSWDHR